MGVGIDTVLYSIVADSVPHFALKVFVAFSVVRTSAVGDCWKIFVLLFAAEMFSIGKPFF